MDHRPCCATAPRWPSTVVSTPPRRRGAGRPERRRGDAGACCPTTTRSWLHDIRRCGLWRTVPSSDARTRRGAATGSAGSTPCRSRSTPATTRIGLGPDDPTTTLERSCDSERDMLNVAASREEFLAVWRWQDWNELRVRLVGAQPLVTTWVNRSKVAELDMANLEAPHYDAGALATLLRPAGTSRSRSTTTTPGPVSGDGAETHRAVGVGDASASRSSDRRPADAAAGGDWTSAGVERRLGVQVGEQQAGVERPVDPDDPDVWVGSRGP